MLEQKSHSRIGEESWISRSWGVAFMAVESSVWIEYKACGKTFSHWFIGRHCVLSARVITLHNMPLYLSHCPLSYYGGIQLVEIPYPCKVFTSVDKKLEPLSKCMYISIPKMIKIWVRHLITVCNDTSRQAKVNGKQEYLSITINRNRLWEDGRVPLKSTLSLSKDMVDFIKERISGW